MHGCILTTMCAQQGRLGVCARQAGHADCPRLLRYVVRSLQGHCAPGCEVRPPILSLFPPTTLILPSYLPPSIFSQHLTLPQDVQHLPHRPLLQARRRRSPRRRPGPRHPRHAHLPPVQEQGEGWGGRRREPQGA